MGDGGPDVRLAVVLAALQDFGGRVAELSREAEVFGEFAGLLKVGHLVGPERRQSQIRTDRLARLVKLEECLGGELIETRLVAVDAHALPTGANDLTVRPLLQGAFCPVKREDPLESEAPCPVDDERARPDQDHHEGDDEDEELPIELHCQLPPCCHRSVGSASRWCRSSGGRTARRSRRRVAWNLRRAPRR